MWSGVIGDKLTGPYIFPQRLTGDIYANFMQDEVPALVENVPVQTRRQMYYQHDGATPHFSQVIRQYLNHKFPNRWIGRGSAQNWQPWSLDLNPLEYHVCGYMKDMVYAQKVNMREELISEFSALQEASKTVRLQVLWSQELENVSKRMENSSNNFLEC